MKIFGLIVALLIWLLTAFGCSPVKPAEQPKPTAESIAPTSTPWIITTPTVAPAATPAEQSGRSSSSHRSHSSSDSDSVIYVHDDSGQSYPTEDHSDREDTLMPEVGGDDDDSSYSDDHDSQEGQFSGHDSEDTLLPEL